MNNRLRVGLVLLSGLLVLTSIGCVQKRLAVGQRGEHLTRLFFQDHKTRTLKWVDVRITNKGKLSPGDIADVKGWKKLNPDRQKLVQMRECNGMLLVGVRDNEDGDYQSGWVLLHTGVGYVDHGDHGHWRYKRTPAVWDSRLDRQQGNPAHIYLYGNRFYIANDQLNGYTCINPIKYVTNAGRKLGKDTPRFLVGGGNHITLAVVQGKVGYSCWIDGGGPNKGKVDVTPITNKPRSEPAYSFHLPFGGIHGATGNSGKVFFAPSDGICWVQADVEVKRKPTEVKVHHIALGKDGNKPRRTGAFVNHERYVLFVTGKEETSSLVLLDARQSNPTPIRVPLKVQKGSKALTPIVANTREGKAYAFIFHDHDRDVEVEDRLSIITLDPNGDGNCKDARVLKTLKVGKSAVTGHFGHHALACDADRRYAFFTNPGDGTISVLSLKKLEIVETLDVGGMPTHIVARGGMETDD